MIYIDGVTTEHITMANENLSKTQEENAYSIEKTINLLQQTGQLPESSDEICIPGRTFFLTPGESQKVKFNGETYRLGLTVGGSFTITHSKNKQETTWELEHVYPIIDASALHDAFAKEPNEKLEYIIQNGILGGGIQEIYVDVGTLFVLYGDDTNVTHTRSILIPLGKVEDIKKIILSGVHQNNTIFLPRNNLATLFEYVEYDILNITDSVRKSFDSCIGVQARFKQVEK